LTLVRRVLATDPGGAETASPITAFLTRENLHRTGPGVLQFKTRMQVMHHSMNFIIIETTIETTNEIKTNMTIKSVQ